MRTLVKEPSDAEIKWASRPGPTEHLPIWWSISDYELLDRFAPVRPLTALDIVRMDGTDRWGSDPNAWTNPEDMVSAYASRAFRKASKSVQIVARTWAAMALDKPEALERLRREDAELSSATRTRQLELAVRWRDACAASAELSYIGLMVAKELVRDHWPYDGAEPFTVHGYILRSNATIRVHGRTEKITGPDLTQEDVAGGLAALENAGLLLWQDGYRPTFPA